MRLELTERVPVAVLEVALAALEVALAVVEVALAAVDDDIEEERATSNVS